MTHVHGPTCGCCDCMHRPPKNYILECIGKAAPIWRCNCACYAPVMQCQGAVNESYLRHCQEAKRQALAAVEWLDKAIAELEASHK